MFVAGAHTHEVAVSGLETANVVANGALVLDHVTTHHAAEVLEITPLHCSTKRQVVFKFKI